MKSNLPYYAPTGEIFLAPFAEKHGIDPSTVLNWLDSMGLSGTKAKLSKHGQPRAAISKYAAEQFERVYGDHGLPTRAEWLDVIKATGGPSAEGWRNVAEIVAAAKALYLLHRRDILVTPEGPPKPEEWGEAVALLGEKLNPRDKNPSQLKAAA